MMVVVVYDVAFTDAQSQKRLRRIAKHCQDYGLRVQYSVFECEVSPAQWAVLKEKLLREYNAESDSLRFYHLGSKWQRKIEHHGAKSSFDMFRDPLIL